VKEEEGGVRSGPGAARTILLFHTISARPSKQPLMVGSTLGVYTFGLIFVSARTNRRHHHHLNLSVLTHTNEKNLFCNGDLTLALDGWWWSLRAGAGREVWSDPGLLWMRSVVFAVTQLWGVIC